MSKRSDCSKPVSSVSVPVLPRRGALQLAGALAGGLLLSPFARGVTPQESSSWQEEHSKEEEGETPPGKLPVSTIEQIVGAQGSLSNGVLDISIGRKDIGNVSGPLGVAFTSDFEIHGDLYFQPLRGERALLNGDMALLEDEVNPFISKLLSVGLLVQAYHQHLIGMSPQIWFVHFRGVDTPAALATKVRAALATTATPFPQTQPQNPTSPLDAKRLGRILHGEAQIGGDGVVTVTVNRRRPVRLGGVTALPDTGVSTTVEFKPLGGSTAAAVPDFSMTADEVVPVMELMLNRLHWFQGCLYNQETDEHPQLYFDHMLKTGDAYTLAQEIREGLNLTGSR